MFSSIPSCVRGEGQCHRTRLLQFYIWEVAAESNLFFFFPFSFHPPPITSPQEVQPMKCMECLYVYLYQITFIAEAADVTCPRFYIKFISKQGQSLVGSSSVLSSVLLWFLSPQICKGYQQWEKIVRLSVLLLEVTALLFSFSPVPFPDRSTG